MRDPRGTMCRCIRLKRRDGTSAVSLGWVTPYKVFFDGCDALCDDESHTATFVCLPVVLLLGIAAYVQMIAEEMCCADEPRCALCLEECCYEPTDQVRSGFQCEFNAARVTVSDLAPLLVNRV
jgi:hypothetical protein